MTSSQDLSMNEVFMLDVNSFFDMSTPKSTDTMHHMSIFRHFKNFDFSDI